METIQLTITQELVIKAIEAALPKVLNDSYDSPIRKCVEAAVKEKDGVIRQLVDQSIVNALTNPEFKAKIADMVLQKMVESALRK